VWLCGCHAVARALRVWQVNTDFWEADPMCDLMESSARRAVAAKLLQRVAHGSSRDRWRALSTSPIRNDCTVYGVVMVPAQSLYESGANVFLDGYLEYRDAAHHPGSLFAVDA
jgi:hypothetical protein